MGITKAVFYVKGRNLPSLKILTSSDFKRKQNLLAENQFDRSKSQYKSQQVG
jgi:hypothetical protein